MRQNLLKEVQEDVAPSSVFLNLSVRFNNATRFKMIHENIWADYNMFISFSGYVSVTGTAVAPTTFRVYSVPFPFKYLVSSHFRFL